MNEFLFFNIFLFKLGLSSFKKTFSLIFWFSTVGKLISLLSATLELTSATLKLKFNTFYYEQKKFTK